MVKHSKNVEADWQSFPCEHARLVGVGTRKHRSLAVISQWMVTTSMMQRNFLSGPWMQHLLFFYAFLGPEDCGCCSKITKEPPPEKLEDRRSSNTGFAGMPPSLSFAYDFLPGMPMEWVSFTNPLEKGSTEFIVLVRASVGRTEAGWVCACVCGFGDWTLPSLCDPCPEHWGRSHWRLHGNSAVPLNTQFTMSTTTTVIG